LAILRIERQVQGTNRILVLRHEQILAVKSLDNIYNLIKQEISKISSTVHSVPNLTVQHVIENAYWRINLARQTSVDFEMTESEGRSSQQSGGISGIPDRR
jgi:hypothetical protein